jgi:hypothetical protein
MASRHAVEHRVSVFRCQEDFSTTIDGGRVSAVTQPVTPWGAFPLVRDSRDADLVTPGNTAPIVAMWDHPLIDPNLEDARFGHALSALAGVPGLRAGTTGTETERT